MKSVIVSVIVVCCYRVTLAQQLYEVAQNGFPPADFYCIDTYKTDFAPGDELVRPERSFFKKLFKSLGKRLGDCIPCCQNNAAYSDSADTVDYNNNGNYENSYPGSEQSGNGYESGYGPPDVSPAHILVPLPHPHRVMSHLHSYFNRPFRRGGKISVYDGYPPKYADTEENTEEAPGGATVEEPNIPTYEEPAAVEEEKPTYSEAVDEKPTYSEKEDYSGSAESSEAKTDDYNNMSDYKKDIKSENAYAAQAPPATPQIIQSFIPIMIPPVYIYPPAYYAPTASYGAVQSYSPSAPATSLYSQTSPSYTPIAVPESPPASSYTPPAASKTPPALLYSSPLSSYSPPESVYSVPASPYPSLESYNSLLNNPSNCSPSPNYYKRTYSTSLTYLVPPNSPPPSRNAHSYQCNDADQPMKSCPELFTSYGDDLGASYPY